MQALVRISLYGIRKKSYLQSIRGNCKHSYFRDRRTNEGWIDTITDSDASDGEWDQRLNHPGITYLYEKGSVGLSQPKLLTAEIIVTVSEEKDSPGVDLVGKQQLSEKALEF